MNEINMENAITRRIKNLQILWQQFRASPTARCCCWTVQQDEWTMMNTFYKVMKDKLSKNEDIFFRFDTPFLNSTVYEKDLIKELAAQVEEQREDLDLLDIIVGWQPEYGKDPKNEAVYFLRNLFRFAETEQPQKRVVAFISPASIANAGGWEKWWSHVLALKLPEKINLMVCDTIGDQKLLKVAEAYPEKMMCFTPKLEMDTAIRELMNESGSENNGGSRFEKSFFELQNAIDRRDSGQIREHTHQALSLARRIDAPYLEIAVLCTAANGYGTVSQSLAMAQEYLAMVKRINDLLTKVTDNYTKSDTDDIGIGEEIINFKTTIDVRHKRTR